VEHHLLVDDATGVKVTKVKVAHITELTTAVNAVRSLAGLSAAQWTNQTLTASVAVISADDVRDLRLKLNDALTTLGIQTSSYDDQTLAGAPNGTIIKKVHITQLRLRATSGTGGAGGSSANQFGVEWLVTDQLGTPRMVFDETGSLANVKRHDYLPFGEDLIAGARATTPGYGAADGVRQKFTGYERDGEINLDYAQARYVSNAQGRFTSPDPFIPSIDPWQPQSMNRYSYVINNPLNLTDPLGLYFVGGGTAETNLQDDKTKEPPIDILTIPTGDLQIIRTTINLDQDSRRYISDSEASVKAVRKMGGISSLSDAFDARGKTESRFEDRSGTAMSRLLTVAGTASTIAEYSTVSPLTGAWRGANGLRYAAGHHPNGATGPLSLAAENAGVLRGLGRVLGAAGIAMSIGRGYQAYERGDRLDVVKCAFDAGFGAAGTFGGPHGAAAATVYFGVDMTVGWGAVGRQASDHPMITGVTPVLF
jgi:RHS repeat-associated protein